MIKLEWMDGWNELVRWGLVSNRERKDLKVSFLFYFFLNVNFSFPFFFLFQISFRLRFGCL